MSSLDLQIRLKAFDQANSPLRRLIQTSRDLQTSLQKSGSSLDKLTRLKAQADGFEPLRQKTRALGESIKPLQARMNALNDTLGKQRGKQAELNHAIAAGEKAYKQYERDIERINRSLSRMDERKKSDSAQKASLRAKRERLLAEQRLEGESLQRLTALRERYGRFVDRNAQQLSGLEQQLGQTRQDYHAMRDTLIQHRRALRSEGYDVRDMGAAQRRLGQDVDRTTRALHRQQQAMNMRQTWARSMESFSRSAHRARVLSEHGAFVGGGAIMAGQQILHGFARLGQGARGFVDTAQSFERYQTILKTTEGSAKAAEKSMQWISEFAVKTPYELDETTDAFVRLRAYGLDPTNGLLQTLGDTSAAMGKPLMQAVEAIADAITGENERLKEFGIKASKKGGTITYTYTDKAGIQQMAKVAANNRKQIEETLSRIWGEKYGGAMGELAATFGGTVANLGDQWTRFQKTVMDSGVFKVMTARIQELLETLDKMAANGEMQRWAKDLADIMLALFETLWETGRAIANMIKAAAPWIRANKDLVVWAGKWLFFAGVFLSAFGPLYMGFTFIASGAIKFIAALKLAKQAFLLLSRAFLTNPIVLAIAAIITAAWVLYDNWDKVTAYLRDRWEAIQSWWANFSFVQAVQQAFAGIGEFLRTIGQIMWDSLTTMGQNMADALRDTDYAGAIKAAFQGAIDFLLTLGGYFATLIIEAGKQVVAAILGWDVYNTLVNLFSEAIDTVIGKINTLIAKLKEAWQAFKELIGIEEKSILARTDLGPQTPREKSQAAHRLFQQNAQRLKHEARAAELDAYRKNNPQLDALLRRAEQHTQKSPLTTPPLRKPQAANTQTVNIHINADGMGNKEAAALIGAEIKKEMAALDRKQKAAARSAFYDAHA